MTPFVILAHLLINYHNDTELQSAAILKTLIKFTRVIVHYNNRYWRCHSSFLFTGSISGFHEYMGHTQQFLYFWPSILTLVTYYSYVDCLFFWRNIITSDTLAYFVQSIMSTVLYLILTDHLQGLGILHILFSL